MELIDTHCHLQFEKLTDRIDEVINDAASAGVTGLICVGTNVEDSEKAIKIAAAYDNVWASAGVHPHDAGNFLRDSEAGQRLTGLYKQPKVVAVGEIGLDFYKNYSSKADQEKLLRKQLESTSDAGLPYIFHVRDAWDDFWRIFDDYRIPKGVIHSFSADVSRLDQALNRGLHVALNGIMTFTQDKSQLEAAKIVPEDRLVLETDAPFLAPAPMRTELCEPRHTAVNAEFIAKLRGVELNSLAAVTTANAIKLFGLDKPAL
jgi:TatD DNase family protein